MRLSVAEQRLVRLCRIIGYGHIDCLYVTEGEPTHFVGPRAIECRVDPSKSDARCVEPFDLQESAADIELHANEIHLVEMIRSIERGFLRITVKDGIPVSWAYYPDIPERSSLRSAEVDRLRLSVK